MLPTRLTVDLRAVVYLDDFDISRADGVAEARLQSAVRRRRKDYLGQDSLSSHVLGARCELAAANFLQKPWSESVDTFNAPDIEPDFQVRGVRHQAQLTQGGKPIGSFEYRLKVKNTDVNLWRCILVVQNKPRVFELLGWIVAQDAKHQRWVDDPGSRGKPAYFVPRSELRPILDLEV